MSYAILKLTNYNGYWLKSANSAEAEILAIFLETDIGSNPFQLQEEIKKYHDWWYTYCDASAITLYNGTITLQDIWSEEEDDAKFVTTKDKFIEIIDKWDELYKQKPKEIIITIDGDTVTLTGKND